MAFFWVLALICTGFSALIVAFTLLASQGAPQEAAGFAMACAVSIIPYVFCRSLAAVVTKKPDLQPLVDALTKTNELLSARHSPTQAEQQAKVLKVDEVASTASVWHNNPSLTGQGK